MSRRIAIDVHAAPPSKDGAKSIRSHAHRDAGKVEALREAVRKALTASAPIEGRPVRMVMHYRRGAGKADALTAINGVADIIQRRCHDVSHDCGVWLIDDDANIREFHYTEKPALTDSYEITVEVLEA